ncbi:phosphotransferase enzyme family protein [Paracholeplasma manati]|uniref:phosphotransferase enzyme family protein n=1 Tax=Paracholeplasma manati TaxID=591373 RepID=UPI002407FBDA|nr:aminoglycoside phosphotransferase family protein [Paracholeplasma manati]MDG0888982.1 aminoglycoside phosphotransferase family protein [Paracholeplasma manati]
MRHIIDQFVLIGTYQSHILYGSGHINETYLVTMTNPDAKYILQKINHRIFKKVPQLMSNYEKVTQYMKKHLPDGQVFIELLYTKDHQPFYTDDSGYYRMISYIENAIAYQTIPSETHMFLAGQAFGVFQNQLSNFDATSLYETIPFFHHTPKRFDNLVRAIQNASAERLHQATNWIEYALSFKPYANTIIDAIHFKQIPIRVTHNDTKMNNILFDDQKLEVKCIIDLDTIMPGSLLYDFGDAIRFGCNTALEDEKDTSKIQFNEAYFKAYTHGFLSAVQPFITTKEVEMLVDGAIMMTLETGIRFLTDYLENDIYFKTHYPEHNLIRTINQLTYLKKMCEIQIELRTIVQRLWREL